MFWNNFPYSYNCGNFNTPFNGTPGYNSWMPGQFPNWNNFGGFNSSYPQNFHGWNTPAWNYAQSCSGGSCTPWSSYGSPWNYSAQMQNNWGSNWSMPNSFMGSNYDWNCSTPQQFGWNGYSAPQFGYGSFPHGWDQSSFGGFDQQNSFGGQQFPYSSQIPFGTGEFQGMGGFGGQQFPYSSQIPCGTGEFQGMGGFGGFPYGYQHGMGFGGFGMHQHPGFASAQSCAPGFAGQATPGGFNPAVVRDAA